MIYALSLSPRALKELERAHRRYERVGHGAEFLAEVDVVFEAIQAMPRRFPLVRQAIHRALLRRYPFAAFFRIRPRTEHVVVLAVFPQKGDPARWPAR